MDEPPSTLRLDSDRRALTTGPESTALDARASSEASDVYAPDWQDYLAGLSVTLRLVQKTQKFRLDLPQKGPTERQRQTLAGFYREISESTAIDTGPLQDGTDVVRRGERLFEAILRAVDELVQPFISEGRRIPVTDRPRMALLGWYLRVCCGLTARGLQLGQRDYVDGAAMASGTLWGLMWTTVGTGAQSTPPPGTQGAFYALSEAIRTSVADEFKAAGTLVPPSGEEERLLWELLPPGVAEAEIRRLGRSEGLTDLQRVAFARLPAALEQGRNMLLAATTGSGKTWFGRLALGYAVFLGGNGLEVFPIKALVSQEADVWEAWVPEWLEYAGISLRVFPASRDYPENDIPVSKGAFDVALPIYEKLGAYLVSDRDPLSKAKILVVDELQYLTHEDRGPKLEALLTMVNLRPKKTRPSIVGLTATMTRETSSNLRRWLDIGDGDFIESPIRPKPLDTYVVDRQKWRKQADAHLISDPTHFPDPHKDQEHRLSERIARYEGILKPHPIRISTGYLALALVDELLEKDDSRRVICFVPSRGVAEAMVRALHAILTTRLGKLQRRRDANPWLGGRFAQAESLDDRQKELFESKYHFVKDSDLQGAENLVKGFRHGVVDHSAAQPMKLRRVTEEEFLREGSILRVLFATDTLAVGMNLPADTVIAAGLTGYSRRGLHLLSPSDLDNKGGRAGRRGQTARPRGEFYILVPSRNDLEIVPELTKADERELTTIDGVFERYVRTRERGPSITSHLRNHQNLAAVVLQVLSADGGAWSEERLEERVREICKGTLFHAEAPEDVPEPATIIEILRSGQFMGPKRNKTAISGLGKAIGRSGLPLSAATTLERLARLADGAGPLDLLFEVARSPIIASSVSWVSLPPSRNPRHTRSMAEGLWDYAWAYGAPSQEERERAAAAATARKGIRGGLPAALVAADAVSSQELRELLSEDPNEVDRTTATALLRAVVAYEWANGIAFGELRPRLIKAVSPGDEFHREGWQLPKLKLYQADIELLCEQMGSTLIAAAEVTLPVDGRDVAADLRTLATSVSVGLPSWLAPLAALRVPSMHRERLARIAQHDPSVEDLEEILDWPEFLAIKEITATDREYAREVIQHRRVRAERLRHALAQNLESVFVPRSEARTFGDYASWLEEAEDDLEYQGTLAELATSLGCDVQLDVEGGMTWRAGDAILRVWVPSGRIDTDYLTGRIAEPGLLVARAGLSLGANLRLELTSVPHVRVVEPDHLLGTMAKLVADTEGVEDISGAELIFQLQKLPSVSVGQEHWHAGADPSAAAPPPFVGKMPSRPAVMHKPVESVELEPPDLPD